MFFYDQQIKNLVFLHSVRQLSDDTEARPFLPIFQYFSNILVALSFGIWLLTLLGLSR